MIVFRRRRARCGTLLFPRRRIPAAASALEVSAARKAWKRLLDGLLFGVARGLRACSTAGSRFVAGGSGGVDFRREFGDAAVGGFAAGFCSGQFVLERGGAVLGFGKRELQGLELGFAVGAFLRRGGGARGQLGEFVLLGGEERVCLFNRARRLLRFASLARCAGLRRSRCRFRSARSTRRFLRRAGG